MSGGLDGTARDSRKASRAVGRKKKSLGTSETDRLDDLARRSYDALEKLLEAAIVAGDDTAICRILSRIEARRDALRLEAGRDLSGGNGAAAAGPGGALDAWGGDRTSG